MKQSFQAAPTNVDDASFRNWGSRLCAALEAVGFIKTADTGQIDWTTVTKPAISTYQGYEIRRLSDTLQSSVPIYAKIEFGAATTATYPKMRITLGRGTDGAGNITGIPATQVVLTCASQNATAYDCYVSGGEGYVAFGMFVTGTSSYVLLFYIARPRDAGGTINNKGFNIVGQSGSTFTQQWYPAVGSPMPNTPMAGPFCTGPKVGTGSFGTTVGVFPVFTYMGYAAHPDGVGIAYFPADMAGGGVVVTLQMFGANHDFVTGGAAGTGFINGNSTVSSLLLRWE